MTHIDVYPDQLDPIHKNGTCLGSSQAALSP